MPCSICHQTGHNSRTCASKKQEREDLKERKCAKCNVDFVAFDHVIRSGFTYRQYKERYLCKGCVYRNCKHCPGAFIPYFVKIDGTYHRMNDVCSDCYGEIYECDDCGDIYVQGVSCGFSGYCMNC